MWGGGAVRKRRKTYDSEKNVWRGVRKYFIQKRSERVIEKAASIDFRGTEILQRIEPLTFVEGGGY